MIAGEIRRVNLQADIYRRRYRLIKQVSANEWEIEWLPIEDEVLDQMMADADRNRYWEDEIERAIDLTGTYTVFRFASRANWDRMF